MHSRAILMLLTAVALFASSQPAATSEDASQRSATELVAKFDKHDPGWKARMESLVQLARTGPDVVPTLIESLQKGSPTAREFAAQALVLFGDARARPALEKALDDSKEGVRLYAVHALSMIGPLPADDRYYRMLESDPCHFGVKPMVAAALGREDKANAAELRKAFADYDLTKMNTARLGELAPDFTLMDVNGKPVRLSDFRGKKAVVLRFILFDF